jgi:hypothetical protein
MPDQRKASLNQTAGHVSAAVAPVITIDIGTSSSRRPARPCPHRPPCPGADAPDREAAGIRIAHPEQGWTLLCNGIVLFDDTGALLPDGRAVAPHRAGGRHRADGPTPT